MYKGMKRIVACLLALPLLVFALPALAEDEPPRIPPGDLAPAGAALSGEGKYDVYTGPGEDYLRPAEGKATVSAKGWVLSFGVEKGWTLITYQLATYQYRFGWIKGEAVSKELAFERVPAAIMADTSLTDDPLGKQGTLATLKEGTSVTRLAKMGIWAYVETEINGVKARGFVPKDALQYADTALQYEDCLYPIRENGKWGYMNYRGETILEPQWADAWAFRGAGYAAVTSEGDIRRDCDGIIDSTGAYVVEPLYSCDEGYDGFYYGGKDTGIICVQGESGLEGFFDLASGFFSGMKYGEVFPWTGGGRLIPVSAAAGEADWWRDVGYADRTTGELAIPYQYCMVDGGQFHEGFAYVEQWEADVSAGTPLIINGSNMALPLPEGFVPGYQAVFFDGRLVVLNTETELYGYVDKDGKLVIPADYEAAEDFDGGTALVTQNGAERYIDRDGKAAKAPEAEGASLFFGGYEGRLLHCGVLDTNGKIVVPLTAGYVFDENFSFGSSEDFVEGMQVLVMDGKYGFLDAKGKEAIPFQWDYAENFENGLAFVKKDGKMAYIDHSGKVVWQEE